ncbi:MAG: PLP-dependent aminotransferase family protein, partial [Defluviitaleaceae bacterium]|nr:PLP-dependent aminotransferase family protein [Defluviitaleaceae bacterium]
RDINHGINILLDELISPGDYVLVETPTSQNAHNIFVSRGAKILEVPFREKNLDAEKFIFLVKKYSPKIFYLSPTFQMPTGLCYTESSKSLALELAYNCGAHILEVNDCGDFFYGARPSPLKAADTRDRVIYLKSFDKILAPGLAGYVVCPREILSRLHADGTSGCIQRSLDFYLNDFDFDAHCAKIRGVYSRRFKRTISAAETFFSRCASFEKPEGGLGIWIRANGNFADEFLARNVLVSPGNLYSAGAQNFFRISFANTHEDDISKGIGIIASVLSTFSNGRQVGNGKRIALDNRDDSTRFD